MPQTLYSVLKVSSYSINYDPACLQQFPTTAALVAEAVARWSAIEAGFGRLLITMLAIHARPGLAMFNALVGAGAQDAALKAAAEATLRGQNLETFQVIWKVAVPLQKQRNKLAHNLWAYSPEIPDALLLADSQEFVRQHMVMDQAVRIHPNKIPEGMTFEEYNAEIPTNTKRIFVYRDRDIERNIRDIKELDFLLGNFIRMLARHPYDQPPDELYRQLSKKRLFREALSRLREGQKKNPPAQP